MNRLSVGRIVPAALPVLLLVVLALLLTGCFYLNPAMSYQGRLLRPNGAPVANGNYNFRFNLYTASTGGTPVYTETQTINVANGLFSTSIGGSASPDIFAEPLYLEVTVGGQTLSPRQRLLGAPYANSLVPGARMQGSVPITRTLAGYNDTGAAFTVLNTDSSEFGGSAIFAVNQTAAKGSRRDIVAAIQAHAAGGTNTSVPATSTGATGAYIQSNSYRGLFAKGSGNYAAGAFDSLWGITIQGGGSCHGCTLAYMARNDGGQAIEKGDLVAIAGVFVDPDFNVPVMLVRKATAGDENIIGVASGAAQRTEPIEYLGATLGGYDGKEGPAAPGEYVSVVVQGLAQVKVNRAAGVKMGDRLAPAADGAAPAVEVGASVARALSEVDEDGLVWAMIDAR